MKLTKNKATEYIKKHLLEYVLSLKLEGNLKNNGKGNIRCLSPLHEDVHPSMYLSGDHLKCAKCDEELDTFGVVGRIYNLTDKEEIFEKACEIFNIVIVAAEEEESIDLSTEPLNQDMPTSTKAPVELSNVIKEAVNNRVDSRFRGYLNSRGIFKDDVINHFSLGFDPKHAFYDNNLNRKEYHPALVIPTGPNSLTYRRIDEDSKAARYDKVGSCSFLNLEALDSEANYIVIAEGEFDALSLMEASESDSIQAIALGSVANIKGFLRLIKSKQESLKLNKTFIVELDADEAGVRGGKELCDGLKKLGIEYVTEIGLKCGEKDLNDSLTKHRTKFKETVANIQSLVESKLEEIKAEELKEHNDKFNIATNLEKYKDWLKEKKEEKLIKTGFPELDKILGGGLGQGLYIVGGMPSAGKTAMLLQIADNAAHEGSDVLIFSLEMGRNELITRTLSRLSYLIATDRSQKVFNQNDACTYGDIVANGELETNVNEELLDQCMNTYMEEFAPRMYIVENDGDMTVQKIRSIVQ